MSGGGAKIILNCLSILAGLFVLACGIYIFAGSFWHTIISFVIGVYFILFGVCIVLFEFVFPSKVVSLFGFYTYWFGRGCFISLLGLLILENHGFFLAAGIIVIAIGIAFMVLHFFCPCPSPFFSSSGHSKNNNNERHGAEHA
ncbi:hypothetical protein DICPUDRAFT_149038 [Dictyostelium purpureum]|uniref:COPI associated protein n=1 Tax=Dictyostelium purpureum TaxID=5786 RepID=F0ZCN6_DICPU|nr:uncharacterized protein DICPUDRAFT_149038 [Dictyostelium purpureum]EGC38326.1 hypothetical protein DICPUDRAFT_149038 [Dictyostelium purpureum]|eukprot:XP_003285187.1 hypothetical protein DICPUDRAFT_149038 [Dictyostelium purpureum]